MVGQLAARSVALTLDVECAVVWLSDGLAYHFGDAQLWSRLADDVNRRPLPLLGSDPPHVVVALDVEGASPGAIAVLRRRDAFTQTETEMLYGLAEIVATRVRHLRTVELEARSERRQADEHLRRTYAAIACGITVWSPNGALLEYNQEAEKLMGVQMEPMLGMPLTEAVRVVREDGTEAPATERRVLTVARTGQAIRNYYTTVVSPDGERPAYMQMSAVPVFDSSGQVSRVVCSFFDITERKAAEDMLAHQAKHDPLTGVPNRMLLMDRLERAVELARRSHGSAALLLLDLNGFKAVNDERGHHAGDQLLCEIGQRWSDRLRASDTLARLGGDEFAVLVADGDRADAEAVASALREAMRAEFQVDGVPFAVGASIGQAVFPGDGTTADELLRAADLAMYRDKREHAAGSDPRETTS
jgi:diguanylate cyclase (GGDEF)-like protein/PAS domain S-box-containing protein